MTYLIIERFHLDSRKELYQRFVEKGRRLPNGVRYINSWIDEKLETCYQIMESTSEEKLLEWISLWDDLAEFEIVPVISSGEAKKRILFD